MTTHYAVPVQNIVSVTFNHQELIDATYNVRPSDKQYILFITRTAFSRESGIIVGRIDCIREVKGINNNGYGIDETSHNDVTLELNEGTQTFSTGSLVTTTTLGVEKSLECYRRQHWLIQPDGTFKLVSVHII